MVPTPVISALDQELWESGLQNHGKGFLRPPKLLCLGSLMLESALLGLPGIGVSCGYCRFRAAPTSLCECRLKSSQPVGQSVLALRVGLCCALLSALL